MSLSFQKKGFSLVEMIVVIVIIGIIAAIAVPKLLNTKDEATVSAIKQDVATAVSSIRSYYLMNGSIAKISDAVNLNTKNWSDTNTLVTVFKDDSIECIKITINTTSKTIFVDMLPTSPADVCKKINDAGVVDQEYTLN